MMQATYNREYEVAKQKLDDFWADPRTKWVMTNRIHDEYVVTAYDVELTEEEMRCSDLCPEPYPSFSYSALP